MVYLYKCPICAFRAMDCTKECGSDNFISTAFLSVSPSIGHLAETTSLKMSYVHLPEEEGGTVSCTTAEIHTIQSLLKRKVLERSYLLDLMHVFDVFRGVDLNYWMTGFWVSILKVIRSTWKKRQKFCQVFNIHTVNKHTDLHFRKFAPDLIWLWPVLGWTTCFLQ